ncbi:MAG: hypothetical protein QGG69_06640 [Kiritimatiellia bacterium]|jgi:hypothetical protein|nr:hypothetical protein [Kiritimatiellia bacterium]
MYNFVRCVRVGATAPDTDTDDDGLTDWYEYNYSTNITNMVAHNRTGYEEDPEEPRHLVRMWIST